MFSGLHRRFRPWFVFWATVMWVMLEGEISIGNILAGFIIGCIVIFALPLPAIPVGSITINIKPLIGLSLSWIYGLFAGAIHVAWLSLRPAAPPKTAIVTLPMRVENELILALATTLYNLQPGGTVTDINIGNREWTIHLLDADTPEAIEKQAASVAALESRLIRSFERSAPTS